MKMNILNKAMAAGNTPAYKRKAFQDVADVAASVGSKHIEARAEYMAGIDKAKAAQREAAQEKEDAKTEKQLDSALDKGMRAREKEAFFKKMIAEIDYTPRIDEAVYNACVEKVHAEVSNEISAYWTRVFKAMKEIVDAKESLMGVASDADKVLNQLDASANVLQSKYRYREKQFTTSDPGVLRTEYTEDREEWKNHARRYSLNGELFKMVTDNHDIPSAYDPDYIRAAWLAADKAER